MSEPTQSRESDPRQLTTRIKQMLTETLELARKDVGQGDDPKAQALFETTAEVLGGLKKAYEHYEQRSEGAWKASTASTH